MAAPSYQTCAFRFLRLYAVAGKPTRIQCPSSVVSYSSKPTEEEQFVPPVINPTVDEETLIDKMRDVSGLKGNLYRRNHNKVPEILNEYQQRPKYQRHLYGKFGSESGVDPRKCWPSRAVLRECIELEQDWEPPLEARVAKMEKRRTREENASSERHKKIEMNMKKMDMWVKEYGDRRVSWLKEKKIKTAHRESQLNEAQAYFGYHVDRKDPKFKAMLEEKEKEEKKLSKQKKIADKNARFKSKLEAMAKETTEK